MTGARLKHTAGAVVVKVTLKDAYVDASKHFGQSYFNTATMAGIYRIAVKKLAKKIKKLKKLLTNQMRGDIL